MTWFPWLAAGVVLAAFFVWLWRTPSRASKDWRPKADTIERFKQWRP